MPLHIEPLTGGLVTARDPSLLLEGELVQTDNLIYRPFNQAITPWGTRENFGNAIGGSVVGIRATGFEGATDTRVVIAHTTVWQTGIGGAWTTIRSGLSALQTRLEAIHTNDEYYLSNGINTPIVFEAALTTYGHGMIATEANDATRTVFSTTGGDWSNVGTGFFTWWITEYDSTHDIESAAADPITVVSVATNEYVIRIAIQYGQANYLTLHNSNATHWRIYRSLVSELDINHPPSNISTELLGFPIGELVGEVAIPGAPAITNFDDDGIVGFGFYPTVTISVTGLPAVTIARDTVPPIWSTGDIFEDSMVVNDVSDTSIIRYSFPGLVHSFPALYFIGFETKQQDVVTYIRSINEVCVVGLKTQLWRVNYLPNETDSEFSRGRCKELISANHGIMGPDAACIFTPVNGSSLLAYVSHDGLYATDGLSTQLLTEDLNWTNLVNKDALGTCLLVNNQTLWTLMFYYRAAGAGAGVNNKVLFLSYHPQHLKADGKLKVSGPVTFNTFAADFAITGSEAFKVFVGNDNVYQEDEGPVNEAGTVTTRFIYPKGLEYESVVRRVKILTGAHSLGITHSVALARRNHDTADVVDTPPSSYTPPATGTRVVTRELHGRAEGFGAQIILASDTHYIGFDFVTDGRD